MYRILIFNDSKWRDLPGSALVKYNLQKLLPDSIIEICSFHIWSQAIESFRPHLVILNHIQGRRNKTIASFVKRHGGLVAVQFTEGVVEFEGKANVFAAQKGHKDVDIFLCWNDAVAELVDGVVVGCPRFDIYQSMYSSLIESKNLFCAKHNLDKNKPIVLFGDSWPSAKFTYTLTSFHRENWKDLKNTLADKWADADEFAKHQMDRQKKFRFIVEHAQIELGDECQVVVSSHPMSDYIEWERWGRSNNVTLVPREYSHNLLNASDVFIGKTGSIMIAEAWLLDKPTMSLGTDYDSASSYDQSLASTSVFSWDKDYTFIPDAIRVALNYKKDEILNIKDLRKQYLDEWGFLHEHASLHTARELATLLDTNMPVVGEVDISSFYEHRVEHDRHYLYNKLDGFGNWDKASTQSDVQTWLTGINMSRYK